ncbi:hypothetical protein A7979_11545 [Rothia nasimurium]|uniref:Uncharacterized protein n=1 Tax=Rothia nasimurium TaxID=85336 RepID=A0A1Y1RQL8_9MICC|nr:hypothetical protein [Rothia nasimurium]ORC18620.1 hypothetical protein A7979_11545 [Rothia nasimurium]
MNNITEFIDELPFTIEYFQPDTYALSLAGTTSTGREFSLYLDFYWEVYYEGEILSWDNSRDRINDKLNQLKGCKIVDITGPDNLYDATYILENSGMIRSVTSDNKYATEWSLSVVGDTHQLFAGEIYPYELSDLGTDFSAWDVSYEAVDPDRGGTPFGLIGSKIIKIKLIQPDDVNHILEITLSKGLNERCKLHFWNSWALYSDSDLLMDNATEVGVDCFNSVAQGATLKGFTGGSYGMYGCSLIFDTLKLRQVGSSGVAWSWRIRDDQGNLLWRAPTDVEASRGLIEGVENPS